jgi:hypothetical protein
MTLMGEFLESAPKNTGAQGIGPIAVPNGDRNMTPTLEASPPNPLLPRLLQSAVKALPPEHPPIPSFLGRASPLGQQVPVTPSLRRHAAMHRKRYRVCSIHHCSG